jgi:DNA-binding SARP family transcriptional activator
MNQAPLEINLLGPVEIKFDNELLKINRRIERAILYTLAIEQLPVSRTKLIDLLWPEADQVDPRASLRTALSRLRRELPDPQLILTELDQVWLDRNRVQVDVVLFENQYQHILNFLSTHEDKRRLPESIVEKILSGLALWRGNTLISGDNLENYPEINEWRLSLNRRLNHRRKYLINRLAEHYQNAGKFEKALVQYMLLARIDKSDLKSQCAALDLLIKMGKYQDVINYCDTLENVYEREFNAPLPEAILTRCQHSEMHKTAQREEQDAQWTVPLSMNLKLIGRQPELKQLQEDFYKGGLISIQGEMGSGKTRLVQELFQTLSPKPTLWIATSREMEQSLPFSPIIYCLRHSLPEDFWEEINPIWLNQLRLLLPELTGLLQGELQTPISSLPSGKQYLFDALLNVFQAAAKKSGSKILFFLDDAQWADNQTLTTLSYLLSRGFFEHHGTLVVAHRPEEKNSELDLFIDQSFRSHPVEIIRLHGLSPDETNNLVGQMIDEKPSRLFVDKLFQETNGNPFLAIEIVQDIIESGGTFNNFEETFDLPLPISVHTLMRKRLSQLDEVSRHILLCAAVLGTDLSLDLLQAIADINPTRLYNILDPLIKTGLIHTAGNSQGKSKPFQFSHKIMREVVLREASDVQLQFLHLKVAHQMSRERKYSEKAAVIAEHFLLGDNPVNAFEWTLKATSHAWTLGATEDAQTAFRQAEQLLSTYSEDLFNPDNILSLYQQWSDFGYQSHQVELVEQIGAKLQHIANSINHPLLLGASQTILANACFLRLNFDTGLTLLRTAIENIEIAGEKEILIKTISRKSVFSWWTMNFEEVESSANKVIELCQDPSLNDNFRTSMVFNAKHMINMMYYTHGEANLAVKMAQTLYRQYFHKLEPFDQLRSLYLLGYAHLISAEYDQCEEFTKKGLELTKPLGNDPLREYLLIILSKAEFLQGKFDLAYQHGTQALKSAEKADRKPNIISANCLLGDIYYAIQNFTAAAQHYRVAQIREGFTTTSLTGIENSLHLAHLLSWTNQIQEAREIIQKNQPIIERCNLARLYVNSLLIHGICDFHEGNLKNAENTFTEAIEIAEEKGLPYELTVNKIMLARLMITKNKLDQSEKLINEILDITQPKNLILVSLYGIELLIRINKAKNQLEMVNEYQSALEKLNNELADNMQSDPLKQGYQQGKQIWDTDHRLP